MNENKKYSFYTYKITSSDSNKYYFGVRQIKKENASKLDCMEDTYYGSGGVKFKNWMKLHKKYIIKEIIEIFNNREDAYESERKLIGDLFKEDKNCLNSTRGGIDSGMNYIEFGISLRQCKKHGLVKHRGLYCSTCISNKSVIIGSCTIHGSTKFQGDKCSKCNLDKMMKNKICSIHGLTKHQKSICLLCKNNSFLSLKICDIHGESYHKNDKCTNCISVNAIDIKNCNIHGDTKHRGNTCCKCAISNMKKECLIHGNIQHFANKCVVCENEKSISNKFCKKHGETKHKGKKCFKCSNENSIKIEKCETHGNVKHKSGKCYVCITTKTAHTRFHKNTKKENCPYCILT